MIFKLQFPRGYQSTAVFDVADDHVDITQYGRARRVTIPRARIEYRKLLQTGYLAV